MIVLQHSKCLVIICNNPLGIAYYQFKGVGRLIASAVYDFEIDICRIGLD